MSNLKFIVIVSVAYCLGWFIGSLSSFIFFLIGMIAALALNYYREQSR